MQPNTSQGQSAARQLGAVLSNGIVRYRVGPGLLLAGGQFTVLAIRLPLIDYGVRRPSTGIGTYTQLSHGSVAGLGIVHQPIGITQISAFGNNLILGGQRFGSVNQSSETAPMLAFGTFSLS